MIIHHVIPEKSVFISDLKEWGGTLHTYRINIKTLYYWSDTFKLFSRIQSGSIIIFHYLDFIKVLLFILRGNKKYAFIWGEEFYRYLWQNKQKRKNNLFKIFIARLRRKLFLLAISKLDGIVCSPKKYQIIRRLYRKYFSKTLKTERILAAGYNTSERLNHNDSTLQNSLRVLVCHNASDTLNVEETTQIINRLNCQMKDIPIVVKGYLSYGAREHQRLKKAELYNAKFKKLGIQSEFVTEFLPICELRQELATADIAIFSAQRDEGVNFLRDFLQIGGLVFVPDGSFNYDALMDISDTNVYKISELENLTFRKIKMRRAALMTSITGRKNIIELLKNCERIS